MLREGLCAPGRDRRVAVTGRLCAQAKQYAPGTDFKEAVTVTVCHQGAVCSKSDAV